MQPVHATANRISSKCEIGPSPPRENTMRSRTAYARTLFAAILLLAAQFVSAQTVIETAAEHRFQLDFHVNDAALAKLLPQGWEPVIATQGPAKDCNLRM